MSPGETTASVQVSRVAVSNRVSSLQSHPVQTIVSLSIKASAFVIRPSATNTSPWIKVARPEPIDISHVPDETGGNVLGQVKAWDMGDAVIVTVRVAVPSLPAASVAVAMQRLCVFVDTIAAVNILLATLKLPPLLQVTSGPLTTPISSLTLKVDSELMPDSTESVIGEKLKLGAVVSGGGVIVTVRVAVPALPAASLAVAVQTLCVFVVTIAAVKILLVTSKLPPLLQVTSGPTVTPTSSAAVKVDIAVMPDSTVSAGGAKLTAGAVKSMSSSGSGSGIASKMEPSQADTKIAEIKKKLFSID